MHNLEGRWQRYPIAAAGLVASLMLLAASALMNYRYGCSMGRTATDCMIYGSAASSADVLMASAPFFFFAAIKNREVVRALAALLLWAVTTAFAAQSAIGHAAMNRLDTVSARAVTATSYQDTRTELAEARKSRGFIPQHRPEATVRAELEKHKTNRFWSVTNECTEAAGAQTRAYCSTYQTLNGELGYAMQAAKIDARIASLVEASDKAVAEHGSTIRSEADPAATALSVMSGQSMPHVQSAIIFLIALMILSCAGLGPYVSMAIVQGRSAGSFTQPSTTAPPDMLAEVTFSTPLPAPEPPAGQRMLPAPLSRPEPPPEGKVVLARIGFPKVKPDGEARAMTDEERETVGLRLLTYFTANAVRGDFGQDKISALCEEFFAGHGLVPCAERIAKASLADVHKGRKYYATKTVTSPVVWNLRLPDFEELHGLLDKAGFPAAPKAGKSSKQAPQPATEEIEPTKGSILASVLPFAEAPPAPPDGSAKPHKEPQGGLKAPIKGISEWQRLLAPNLEAMRVMGRQKKAMLQQRFMVRDRKQSNKHWRSRAA